MSTSVIGQPISRIDGKLKVTGAAPYGAEHAIENVAYGVPVIGTIGSGRVTRIGTSVAEKMPGVLGIIHHGNIEPMYRPAQGFEQMIRAGETRPPFEDNNVYYYGQYIALVIAETFQQAQAAATEVQVEYHARKPLVRLQDSQPEGKETSKYTRGDAESAFAQAPVKVDQTYITPVETHNPMEMHATIAVWNQAKDKLTLYETTQGVVNHHNTLCQMLDMPLESVHIISPFVELATEANCFPGHSR